MKLTAGNRYKFKFLTEKLIFIGKDGAWNQFERIDQPDIVWCEITDDDLYLIEELPCDY